MFTITQQQDTKQTKKSNTARQILGEVAESLYPQLTKYALLLEENGEPYRLIHPVNKQVKDL